MDNIFYFLVFPGFLFTAAIGLFASWVDRKITARIQWRVGPPFYQPFLDIIKLLGKEIIIPEGASSYLFLLSPAVGLAAVTCASTILGRAMISPGQTFVGDLIVVLYLLSMPAIAVLMGAFASKNPLASLGASREMKMLLAYELPFILSVLVPVIISGGIIKIGGLIKFQQENGIFLSHISGVLAFLAAVMCIQAKLSLVPFDASEAEAEIMSGVYIEYSGAGLAIYKLVRAMNLFVAPLFLTAVFCGGISFDNFGFLWGILKIAGIILLATLIRNVNPRLRIDQAVKFFWGPVLAAALAAVLLAFLGL